ncbi:MAG: hypothetical protein O3B01_06125 [Planctomycetota bacterium]|nr:hypothetical protein [Planctomycetota bacterium]
MNREEIYDWVERARDKCVSDSLEAEDFDELLKLAGNSNGIARQRLLYLHSSSPSIRSGLIGHALHEPVKGSTTQIDPLVPELPYHCVHDAILDGWRVIHFPQQLAPFEDREIDIIGYEFILEKIEVCDV